MRAEGAIVTVTAYVDASADHARGRAAYGCWIRAEGLRVLRSGICKGGIVDSNEAEAYAMYAALCTTQTVARRRELTFTQILFVSDSQTAIRLLKGEQQGWSPASREVAVRFGALRRDLGVEVRFRWVKAHGKGMERPSYVNNRVDEMAKRALRTGRGFYTEHEPAPGEEPPPAEEVRAVIATAVDMADVAAQFRRECDQLVASLQPGSGLPQRGVAGWLLGAMADAGLIDPEAAPPVELNSGGESTPEEE